MKLGLDLMQSDGEVLSECLCRQSSAVIRCALMLHHSRLDQSKLTLSISSTFMHIIMCYVIKDGS